MKSMIDCLIFSKDRACQLDLLLRSVSDNFHELDKKNIRIIYKSSNDDFEKGYNNLISMYPEIEWIKETHLITDIKKVVQTFNNELSLCLVDDEVVNSNMDISQGMKTLLSNPTIHCMSLRMHLNINYTYTSNTQSPPPSLLYDNTNNLIVWQWADCKNSSDWGYPSCINSHLYRKDFFKNLIISANVSSVNELEGYINSKRNTFPKHILASFQSKTINIANNLTQSGNNRFNRDERFSLENLNEKYLHNFRIVTNNIYNTKNTMATYEQDYEFELYKNKIENKFKIIIPTYNAEKWVGKCIKSLKSQSYNNWEAIIINDNSSDNTKKMVEKYVHTDKRFTILNRKNNVGALKNIVDGIKKIGNDNDIIVLLDGDDWLYDSDVFKYLNVVYNDNKTMMSHGQYKTVTDNVIGNNKVIPNTRDYRLGPIQNWCTSHLRSFRYKLWTHIKDDDLKDTKGKYYEMAWDIAIMMPLIELAGNKRIFSNPTKILYVYNNDNPLNDFKKDMSKQKNTEVEIRAKKQYEELTDEQI
jgi:hypothetical protein